MKTNFKVVRLEPDLNLSSSTCILKNKGSRTYLRYSPEIHTLFIHDQGKNDNLHVYFETVVNILKLHFLSKGTLLLYIQFFKHNISTVNFLFQLFRVIRIFYNKGKRVKITWIIDINDSFASETVRDFDELYKLSSKIITI